MISLVVEDAPFLLSTIAGALDGMQLGMANHAYPEFGVVRDDSGAIRALRPARGADERQTWIHVELTRRLGADRLDEVAAALRAVLDDALRATGDFDAMRARVERIADRVRKRYDVTVRPADMKQFKREVGLLKKLYTEAWEENWGQVRGTDAEFDYLANDLR